MSDLLPTMIVDEPDDEPLDDEEAILAALPVETIDLMAANNLTARDILDGKVPGIDPAKLLHDFRNGPEVADA